MRIAARASLIRRLMLDTAAEPVTQRGAAATPPSHRHPSLQALEQAAGVVAAGEAVAREEDEGEERGAPDGRAARLPAVDGLAARAEQARDRGGFDRNPAAERQHHVGTHRARLRGLHGARQLEAMHLFVAREPLSAASAPLLADEPRERLPGERNPQA